LTIAQPHHRPKYCGYASATVTRPSIGWAWQDGRYPGNKGAKMHSRNETNQPCPLKHKEGAFDSVCLQSWRKILVEKCLFSGVSDKIDSKIHGHNIRKPAIQIKNLR